VLVYGGAVIALTVRISIEVALSRNLVPSYELLMARIDCVHAAGPKYNLVI